MCHKNYIGKLVKLFNDIPTKLIKNFLVSFLSLYRQALTTVQLRVILYQTARKRKSVYPIKMVEAQIN